MNIQSSFLLWKKYPTRTKTPFFWLQFVSPPHLAITYYCLQIFIYDMSHVGVDVGWWRFFSFTLSSIETECQKKNSPSDLTYLVMIHILKFELKENSLNKGLEFSWALPLQKIDLPKNVSAYQKYEAFPMGTFNSF